LQEHLIRKTEEARRFASHWEGLLETVDNFLRSRILRGT
jgi:hypothetical protein